MTFKIEKFESVPKQELGAPRKYPFSSMEVGECFEFNSNKVNHYNIKNAARMYGVRNGKSFVTRGNKIYRIK